MANMPVGTGTGGTNAKKEISVHIEKAPNCKLIIKQVPTFEPDMNDSRMVQATAIINSTPGVSITTPCTVNIPKCLTTRGAVPSTEKVSGEDTSIENYSVTATVPSSKSPRHMTPFPHIPYCHSVPCKEKIAGDEFAESRKSLCSGENDDTFKGVSNIDETSDRYYEGINTEVLNQLPTSTRLKTRCDVAVLLGYLRKSPRHDTRDIEDIPPQELDTYLVGFFKSIKKSNGEDYHSVTMPSFMGSFNRYLKILNYPFSLFTSCLFSNTRTAMEERRDGLADAGYGKRISPILSLEDSDINILKERRTFGMNHPVSLLNFIFYSNCIHFKIKKVTDHYRLLWSNFKLKTNSKGREYLILEREGNGGHNTRIRVFAKATPQALCPVSLYKAYRKHRSGVSVPEFYLIPIQLISFNNRTPVWFRNARMGKNALAGIMNKLHSQGSALHPIGNTSIERATSIAETSSLEPEHPTTTSLEMDRSNINLLQRQHTTSIDVDLKEVGGELTPLGLNCNQMDPAAGGQLSSHGDDLQILGISSSNNDSPGQDSCKRLCHTRPIIISSILSGEERKSPLSSNTMQPDKCPFQPQPFIERPMRVTKSVKRRQLHLNENSSESKVMKINRNMLSLVPNSPSSTSDETPQHRRGKHVSELCPYTGRFLLSNPAQVNTASEKRTMLAGYESPTHRDVLAQPYPSPNSEFPPHPVALISVKEFQKTHNVTDTTELSPRTLADFTHEVSASWAYRDIEGSTRSIEATTTSTSLSQVCSSRPYSPATMGRQHFGCTSHLATGSAYDTAQIQRRNDIVGHSSSSTDVKGAAPPSRPMLKICHSENNIFTIMSNVRTTDAVVESTNPVPDSSLPFSPMKLASKTVVESYPSGSPLREKQNRTDNLPVIVSVRSLAGTLKCNGEVDNQHGTANSERSSWPHPQGKEVPIKPSEQIANEDEQEMLALQTFSSHIYCLPDQNARLPNLVCPSEKDWQTIEEHTRSGYGFPTAPAERRLPAKMSLLAGHSVEKYHRLLLELFPLLSELQYSVYCRVTDDQHGPLVMVDLHDLKKIPPFLFVIPYKHHERRPLPILVSIQTSLRSESPESRHDQEPTSILKSLMMHNSPNQRVKNLLPVPKTERQPSVSSEMCKSNSKTQNDLNSMSLEITNISPGKTVVTLKRMPSKFNQISLQRPCDLTEASEPIIKMEDGHQDMTSKGSDDKEDISECDTCYFSPSKRSQDTVNLQNNEGAPVSKNKIHSTSVNEGEVTPLGDEKVNSGKSRKVKMKRKWPQDSSNSGTNIHSEHTLSSQSKQSHCSESDTSDWQIDPEELPGSQKRKAMSSPIECFKGKEFIPTSDDGPRVLVDAKNALVVPESRVSCKIIKVRSDHYVQDVYDFYKRHGPATNYTVITKLEVTGKRFYVHLDTTVMFFRFWQLAVKVWFKGNSEFVPVLSASFDSECFAVLGTILAHGLVHCSYWPVQISKACSVFILTGSQCSDLLLKSSFLKCIPDPDSRDLGSLVDHPPTGSSWNSSEFIRNCEHPLSTYGYNETPTWSNIDSVIRRVSETHLLHQPHFALVQMNRGLKDVIKSKGLSEQDVIDLYENVEPEVASIQRHAEIVSFRSGDLSV